MDNATNNRKNTLEGTNSRETELEKRLNEIEDRMVEIAETEKKKLIKNNENSIIDLWDNIKLPNVQIIKVPEELEEKKGHKKIFEEIIVKSFTSMGKETATLVQEAQRVPYKINLKKKKKKCSKTHNQTNEN